MGHGEQPAQSVPDAAQWVVRGGAGRSRSCRGALSGIPRYLRTEAGSRLLVDGWWRYVRKPHYTADALMALSWGLICGFDRFLPYFYVVFFVVMILHRAHRDAARCRKKYGIRLAGDSPINTG